MAVEVVVVFVVVVVRCRGDGVGSFLQRMEVLLACQHAPV
jgi:hypothetical protein